MVVQNGTGARHAILSFLLLLLAGPLSTELAAFSGETAPSIDGDLHRSEGRNDGQAGVYTRLESSFDIVLNTPIFDNVRDDRYLASTWGVCTGLVRVIHEYFLGQRKLPDGYATLREYSRALAPKGKEPRPHALWSEIVTAQLGDALPCLFRQMGFGKPAGEEAYAKIRKTLAGGHPAEITFKVTGYGVLHTLLIWRIDEGDRDSVLWCYDCNHVYIDPSRGYRAEQARRYHYPAAKEGWSPQAFKAWMRDDPKGRTWAAKLTTPAKTCLLYDRKAKCFRFSKDYLLTEPIGGYFKTYAHSQALILHVTERKSETTTKDEDEPDWTESR